MTVGTTVAPLWADNMCTFGIIYPESKIHGANVGHTWGRQDPGGPHIDYMNLVIRVSYVLQSSLRDLSLWAQLNHLHFLLKSSARVTTKNQ